MRRWLLKKLGGVDRAEFMRLLSIHRQFIADVNHMVQVHQMQGAWQEAQQYRKQRRYH